MEENAAAADLELMAGEVSELEQLCSPGAASGDGYTEAMARLIDKAT